MTIALPLLAGIAGIVIGAFVTHRLTSRRDRANRRSEMRIDYLLNAYRSLAAASNRDGQRSASDARAFEQALDDIQLLGSSEQAERAAQLALTMAAKGGASADDLLKALRDDLRAELDLAALPDSPVLLRLKPSQGNSA